MFFRRGNHKAVKGKNAKDKAAKPARTPAAGQCTGKARTTGAASRANAAGGAQAGRAAAPQTREEAERLILRRLADGSVEKQRRLAELRDAGQFFDDYPDEAARLVRNWLSDRKG